MNSRWISVTAWFALLIAARAQLSVEVALEQDKFLPGEPFEANVRVVNTSGQTLQLGESPDWVTFTIEELDGLPIVPHSAPPVRNPFELASTKRATMTVDLAPHFDLRKPGRYRIAASVTVTNWGRTLKSAPAEFEVIEGTKLWEQEFGVPAAEPGQPPEMRRYALQQANYLRRQLRLYVRVSRADGTVLKLIRVGQMISFSNPDPRIDRRSRLHLLYQNGAKSFDYLVINPDGQLEARQTHEYGETRPRLRLDESGDIKVVGGVRLPRADDLPAPTDKPDDQQTKSAASAQP